jgi:hypothetical protein
MSSRVKLLAVASALMAAGGLAWLGSAAAFDSGFDAAPQLAQAAPPAAAPPAAGGGSPNRPMGPAEMRGMRISPKEMCVERVARRAGNRAYLKERLDLKPEQLPLWDNFQKAADAAGAKDKARCASLPTDTNTAPSFMDRFSRREEMTKGRLESLEAVKPSLQALYASLTPEQKAIVDRPMMGRGGFHHHNRG